MQGILHPADDGGKVVLAGLFDLFFKPSQFREKREVPQRAAESFMEQDQLRVLDGVDGVRVVAAGKDGDIAVLRDGDGDRARLVVGELGGRLVPGAAQARIGGDPVDSAVEGFDDLEAGRRGLDVLSPDCAKQ